MTMRLITYTDSTGNFRTEYTPTVTGAMLRVEELESAGYTDVSEEPV
jgi:hypothetical protein